MTTFKEVAHLIRVCQARTDLEKLRNEAAARPVLIEGVPNTAKCRQCLKIFFTARSKCLKSIEQKLAALPSLAANWKDAEFRQADDSWVQCHALWNKWLVAEAALWKAVTRFSLKQLSKTEVS